MPLPPSPYPLIALPMTTISKPCQIIDFYQIDWGQINTNWIMSLIHYFSITRFDFRPLSFNFSLVHFPHECFYIHNIAFAYNRSKKYTLVVKFPCYKSTDPPTHTHIYIYIYIYIYSLPDARAWCDIRSTFELVWIQFSFSSTSCLIRVKVPTVPDYLTTAEKHLSQSNLHEMKRKWRRSRFELK